MGLPEIKLGLIPAYGGTQRLPRAVGESRALEMILSGRGVDAQEAETIGLIHRCVEGDLLAAGIEFARGFCGHSLVTAKLARQAVRQGLDVSLDRGLQIEANGSTRAYFSEDAVEGMSAFIEKRKAKFVDR